LNRARRLPPRCARSTPFGIRGINILREYRRKQRFTPAHEERRDKIRAARRKLRRALAKRPA
jgi:hypothetical protein